jgi:phosphatidylglycerophosphate synthase
VARRESAITVGRYRTGTRATAERRASLDSLATVVAGVTVTVVYALSVGAVYDVPAADIAAGIVVGPLPAVLSAAALLRRRPRATTPADRVTLGRAALACGCAAITVLVVMGPAPAQTWWLCLLATATLSLDAVDGWVARRTGTPSDAGALLDMQVDAGVLMVLSVAVASLVGWWALLIGAMHYLYVAASWVRPALRAALPRSRFRVVVAATQGIALTVALAPFVSVGVARAVVACALALLIASFLSQCVAVRRSSHQVR